MWFSEPVPSLVPSAAVKQGFDDVSFSVFSSSTSLVSSEVLPKKRKGRKRGSHLIRINKRNANETTLQTSVLGETTLKTSLLGETTLQTSVLGETTLKMSLLGETTLQTSDENIPINPFPVMTTIKNPQCLISEFRGHCEVPAG